MLERLITSRWFQVIVLIALMGVMVAFSFSHTRWREQIRNFTFDNYNIMKPRMASDAVVIIDIDEASLKKIGQMPWPRNVMAQMVDTLNEMGAKVIAFDVVFPEPDRSSPDNMISVFEKQPGNEDIIARLSTMPDNDEILGRKIADAGNVVTGFSFTNELTDSVPIQKGIFRGRNIEKFVPHLAGATVNLKEISKDAAGNGSFFVSTDTDGIIRRVPMLIAHQRPDMKIVTVYPSLSLEIMRVLSGERGGQVVLADPKYAELDPQRFGVSGIKIGSQTIPTNARGEFPVYFAKSNKNWYLPAWQVLDRSIAPDAIKDKIVLIGTSAVGLKDIRSTPLDTFLPGVEIHLNIIDQILQGKFLNRSIEAEGMEAVLILTIGLMIILFSSFIGALPQALAVLIIIEAVAWGGLHLYEEYGLLLDVTYLALSFVAIFMLSTLMTYLRSERERRAVRQAFGLYISPEFMQELTSDPDKLRLGGETRDLTVMFTDIRNFTSISEGMNPQELIQLMNNFLTPMSDLVMQNRGTIDKYIGDAMMAFWNAPLDDPDHGRHACQAALKMQAVIEPLNESIKAKGGKAFLKVGIGINSGPAAVGNMGSKQRFAYSVLGDTVNLASRLEGQTKTYSVPIIMGETTYVQVPDFAALELDLIRVKGKAKPVRIFALLGDEHFALMPEFQSLKIFHDQMMAAYRSGDFRRAFSLAEKCENANFYGMTEIYKFYRDRAEELMNNTPANWDGIYEAKYK